MVPIAFVTEVLYNVITVFSRDWVGTVEECVQNDLFSVVWDVNR